MSRTFDYIKRHTIPITIAIMFLSIETIADLTQPMLLSKVIDEGLRNNQISLVIQYASYMLFATLIGLTGALMRNWISSYVSFIFAKDLREALFKKLMKLSFIQVENMEAGSLITRLTVDVNMIQQFINGMMRIFLKAPLLAVGSFFMVLQLDARFLKVYLCLVPVVIIVTLIQLKVGYPLYDKIQVSLDHINQRTMEFLGGIRAVRAFNRFDEEMKQFTDASHELSNNQSYTMQVMSIFGPLIMLVINFGLFFVIFFGKNWYIVNGVGVGQLVAFSNYMTQFYFAMSIISRVFTIFVRAKTSIKRIDDIFSLEVDEKELKMQDANVATDNDEEIHEDILSSIAVKINNLSFCYGQGSTALSELNFSIKTNEKIGIIGSTGSGKTTLIQLIQGILNCRPGEINLYGQDVTHLSKAVISSLIGYVPQKVTLFTGSVLENLSWGERGLSEEEYELALKHAEAFEFVKNLERGLHAQIGRNGIQLSGGQKQRLSLARALVSKPRILILDDVTSAVDVITESNIKHHLSMMQHEHPMTILLVAQKISSVMDLDKILLLDEGKQVGFGSHKELLTTSELYRALYEAEFGRRIEA